MNIKDKWIYDNELRKKHQLTCSEALFLGIIQQTQCHKKGCCYLGNKFFIQKLGLKELWICKTLKKLQSQGVIWKNSHFKDFRGAKGMQRHIVVAKSVSPYRRFLFKIHNHNQLNKFNAEFGDKNETKEPDKIKTYSPRKITCKIVV